MQTLNNSDIKQKMYPINKIILSLLFLTTFQSLHAFVLESLFNIQERAKAKKVAAYELEKYVDQIAPIKQVIYRGLETIIIEDYWCQSIAARKSINNYKEKESFLRIDLSLSAIVDSLLLASLASYAHKKTYLTKPIIGVVIAAAAGIVAHQTSYLKNIPYFDDNLVLHNDEFNNWPSKISRFLTILLETGITFYLMQGRISSDLNRLIGHI